MLVNQTNWVISRKELEAAEMCSKLMQSPFLQVVLRWIINPDLHLPRFVKRRVDRILLVASADAVSHVNRRR